MDLPTLEDDLKKQLIELERYADEYKDKKHPDGDMKCESIFRGKYEAYAFSARKLRMLLKWHSVIEE